MSADARQSELDPAVDPLHAIGRLRPALGSFVSRLAQADATSGRAALSSPLNQLGRLVRHERQPVSRQRVEKCQLLLHHPSQISQPLEMASAHRGDHAVVGRRDACQLGHLARLIRRDLEDPDALRLGRRQNRERHSHEVVEVARAGIRVGADGRRRQLPRRRLAARSRDADHLRIQGSPSRRRQPAQRLQRIVDQEQLEVVDGFRRASLDHRASGSSRARGCHEVCTVVASAAQRDEQVTGPHVTGVGRDPRVRSGSSPLGGDTQSPGHALAGPGEVRHH